MAIDDFKSSDDRTDPITDAAAVDISAADFVLTHVSRGVYVGTAGDLKVDMEGGQTVTWPSASGWMPIRITKVYKTGTTAAGIVVGW
jgi:hypothetical protein